LTGLELFSLGMTDFGLLGATGSTSKFGGHLPSHSWVTHRELVIPVLVGDVRWRGPSGAFVGGG